MDERLGSHYLSPEEVPKNEVDQRADLESLYHDSLPTADQRQGEIEESAPPIRHIEGSGAREENISDARPEPGVTPEDYRAMIKAVGARDRDEAYKLARQHPALISVMPKSWIGPFKAGFDKTDPHWNKEK